MKIFRLAKMIFLSSGLLLSHLFGEKPFVIGDLMGQLGNQFFIIAAATSLALDHDADACFPSLLTEKDFNIPLNWEKIFYHLNASQPPQKIQYYFLESHYYYSPIPYKPNMLIRGWFQSEKYFKNHKEEIMDLFSPHPEIVEYLTQKYNFILEHPNTVSIHFRSYEQEDPEHRVYAKCNLDYFKKAIALFPENTLYVVFSNQMNWCKKNFAQIPRDFYFVENEAHYHDFYLMSMCKHNIICNSTFSWWAAYLNRNSNKQVIAPPQWFNPAYGADDRDLIPEEWIILSESK